ncbi:putative calcineurin-like phosphoesterase [Lyophyllum shimeji]|uniref:Calcineurin-like phosphoesterase n=1 Tax=Lyophyllum shimeji TaxID=47721 RepID=A0A9P3UVC6_LYOSH|nr:putative calcineurin-like phosphoesterase [Lyophyllum shimeji]
MAVLPYTHAPSPPRRPSSISSTNPPLSRRWPENGRISIIAGNHDLTLHIDYYERGHGRWHRDKQDVEQILELLTGPRARAAGLVYLQDSSHTFQTKPNRWAWSVYGSAYESLFQWSPEFFSLAFNYLREEGEAPVAKFPKTNILLTHGPPSGIFDRTCCGDLVGCDRKFEHCSDRANNEAYGTTDVSNVNDSASVPSTRVVVPCTSVCCRDGGETEKNDIDVVVVVAVRTAVTKVKKGGFKTPLPSSSSPTSCAPPTPRQGSTPSSSRTSPSNDVAIRNAIGRTALSEAEARGTEKCLECAGYLLAQMEIDDWGGQEGEADEDEHPPQDTANGPVADGMNKLSLDARNSRPESTADR